MDEDKLKQKEKKKAEKKSHFNQVIFAGFLAICTIVTLFGLTFFSMEIQTLDWNNSKTTTREYLNEKTKLSQVVLANYITETRSILQYANRSFTGFRDEFEAFDAVEFVQQSMNCNNLYYFRNNGKVINWTGEIVDVEQNITALLDKEFLSGYYISKPYINKKNEVEFFIYTYDKSIDRTNEMGVHSVVTFYNLSDLYAKCGIEDDSIHHTYFINSSGEEILNYENSEFKSIDKFLRRMGNTDTDEIFDDLKNGRSNEYLSDDEQTFMDMKKLENIDDVFIFTYIDKNTVIPLYENIENTSIFIVVVFSLIVISLLVTNIVFSKRLKKKNKQLEQLQEKIENNDKTEQTV